MPKNSKTPRSRNPEIAAGIRRFGRVAAFHKGGHWKFSKTGAAGKKTLPKVAPKAEQQKGEPRWYAADDVSQPLSSNKSSHKPTRLRSSLTAGTVLIILAGRFRGKRAIFLKQLSSGLLLVTGPYDINGVPLRRFNQRYVIATSTKVDVSAVDVSKIDDAFFAKRQQVTPKDGKFFSTEEKKTLLPASRKEEQKRVDSAILPVITKVPSLKHYLKAKFSLTKGQRPHELKF